MECPNCKEKINDREQAKRTKGAGRTVGRTYDHPDRIERERVCPHCNRTYFSRETIDDPDRVTSITSC